MIGGAKAPNPYFAAQSMVRQNNPDRKGNDYYPTPPVATYSLVKTFDVPRVVAEPAAGRGWMSRELTRCGHTVHSSDLHEYPDPLVPDVKFGVDFLKTVPGAGVETMAMVTNPPFKDSLPERFVRHAIERIGFGFVAIFARLTFMESEGRLSLFRDYPMTDVAVFGGRVNGDEDLFEKKQLGGMIAYAWYVWDRRGERPDHPRLRWIDTKSMMERWNGETGGSFG